MTATRTPLTAASGPDATLALLGLSLLLVGLVAISSASIEYAEWHFRNPWFHTQRHLVYLLLALTAAVLVYRAGEQWFQETFLRYLTPVTISALLLARTVYAEDPATHFMPKGEGIRPREIVPGYRMGARSNGLAVSAS